MNMANPDKERKRILMVEDQEDLWEMVSLFLPGYKFTFARDFDDGLRLARWGYFDLYILDNWLPKGSGIGLCRQIREFDPYTPVMFYSAAGFDRDIEEAMQSGAHAYLVKPVSGNDLRQVVTRLTCRGQKDSAAWRAEIAAIREEVAILREESVERIRSARERPQRAQERMMRIKAERAFLDVGGTRGEFARRWPSVLTEEVRNHSDDA